MSAPDYEQLVKIERAIQQLANEFGVPFVQVVEWVGTIQDFRDWQSRHQRN